MPSTAVLIFGATGDLARKKLFPTLFALCKRGELPANLRILALGRRNYTRAEFIQAHLSHLQSGEERVDQAYQEFIGRIDYYQMDIQQAEAYPGLVRHLQRWEKQWRKGEEETNRLLYLAVPPSAYADILAAIHQGGVYRPTEQSWTRIVIEKPLGHNLSSAKALNKQIAESFNELNVFRIDHYLAKETVQNLLAFRFANGLFESLWDNQHIDHLQITVAESIGAEGRAGYYDRIGAVRDFIQNHILQLVTFLTMEAPDSFAFANIADAQMNILRNLKADPEQTIFGQYQGYTSEEGVDPKSQTETYAMTTLEIDTPRWRGVPIYLRTGKKLPQKISEVSVQFRSNSLPLYAHTNPQKRANIVSFRIQPDEGIALQLAVKTPRSSTAVQPVYMEFCYGSVFREELPDAYERILRDILLHGDHTLSLRGDVVEESWRIVDELLEHRADIPLASYTEASWGPEAADQLLDQHAREWLTHESTYCNGVKLIPTPN